MEAQEFLVTNPLLYGNEDKYIWIDVSMEERRNAQALFDYLLRKKIYIKGFVSRSSLLIGLKMYNKKIFDIDTLEETTPIFFDSNFRTYTACVESRIQKARIVNPSIGGKNIIIWGAGITGDKVYQILRENGFTVTCFIDSDKEKQHIFKHDLPVYAPDYLDKLEDDIIVIEAVEKWKLIDESIKERKWKRYHFSFGALLTDITCSVNGIEKKLFRLSYFWMFHHLAGKKVYIYGNDKIEKEFATYLKLMDYNFCGFLVDDINENGEDICRWIEEILYEDDYYIWIYDKTKVRRLKELGLKCLEQWECNGLPWDITLDRKEGLDINLGHTSLADDNYPGVVFYGESREDNYKIAILGGSTSDGILYPFRTWPEFLYEDLKQMGITVYNCGVSGYTSGQELIKFIRDVLPLRPDMLIVYDGCNDLNIDVEHPFSFSYSKIIFDFVKEHMGENVNVEYTKKVSEGVKTNLDRFDEYLCNIRNMHAIAIEHNIRFYGFCQPVLSCKQGKTPTENNILLSMPSGRVDFWVTEYFRKDMEIRKDIPDYLYNFTGIFDNEDDVYLDICHVNEKGNRIIASKIKEVIYDAVLQDMDEKNF